MTTTVEDPNQFDEAGVRRLIQRHWTNNSPCKSLWVEVTYCPHRGDWNVLVAPSFQEIVGGSQDGQLVWSAFSFDISDFLEEPEIEVHSMGMWSFSVEHDSPPMVSFKCRFKGKPFFLRISLEPIKNSKALEFVDVNQNHVRPAENATM